MRGTGTDHKDRKVHQAFHNVHLQQQLLEKSDPLSATTVNTEVTRSNHRLASYYELPELVVQAYIQTTGEEICTEARLLFTNTLRRRTSLKTQSEYFDWIEEFNNLAPRIGSAKGRIQSSEKDYSLILYSKLRSHGKAQKSVIRFYQFVTDKHASKKGIEPTKNLLVYIAELLYKELYESKELDPEIRWLARLPDDWTKTKAYDSEDIISRT